MARLTSKSLILPMSIGLGLFTIAIYGTGLEYLGAIDLVPGFGEGRKAIDQPSVCVEQLACTVDRN